MNSENPENSYLLVERIDRVRVIVIGGGNFRKVDAANLLNIYTFESDLCKAFSIILNNVISIVNKWIETSGNYSILNERETVSSFLI